MNQKKFGKIMFHAWMDVVEVVAKREGLDVREFGSMILSNDFHFALDVNRGFTWW